MQAALFGGPLKHVEGFFSPVFILRTIKDGCLCFRRSRGHQSWEYLSQALQQGWWPSFKTTTKKALGGWENKCSRKQGPRDRRKCGGTDGHANGALATNAIQPSVSAKRLNRPCCCPLTEHCGCPRLCTSKAGSLPCRSSCSEKSALQIVTLYTAIQQVVLGHTAMVSMWHCPNLTGSRDGWRGDAQVGKMGQWSSLALQKAAW